MIPTSRAGAVGDDRTGNVGPRRLELARQAVHVVLVVVGPLGVHRPVVVPRAPGEVRGGRSVHEARQRAPGDAVAVDVAVSGELLELGDVSVELLLRPQDLAAVERLVGEGERIGHPVVHPEVQVRHQEDRRLEPLGQVEGVHRHRVALLDRAPAAAGCAARRRATGCRST